jgi:hypothetical protein
LFNDQPIDTLEEFGFCLLKIYSRFEAFGIEPILDGKFFKLRIIWLSDLSFNLVTCTKLTLDVLAGSEALKDTTANHDTHLCA